MLSLETCREWNRSLDRDVVDARRLLASLEASACKNVAESSSSPPKIIEIYNKDNFPLVESCLAGAPSDTPFFKREGEDKIVITTAGVKQLRHLGVNYLNELEVVLSAWQKGVGDQGYLEDQFRFLDTDKSQAIQLFRTAIEGGTTPAIDAFLSRNKKGSDPETKMGQDS